MLRKSRDLVELSERRHQVPSTAYQAGGNKLRGGGGGVFRLGSVTIIPVGRVVWLLTHR